MKVYVFRDNNCGQPITTNNYKDILEWIGESLKCMELGYDNRCNYDVMVKEMSQEEFDKIPEFEGC